VRRARRSGGESKRAQQLRSLTVPGGGTSRCRCQRQPDPRSQRQRWPVGGPGRIVHPGQRLAQCRCRYRLIARTDSRRPYWRRPEAVLDPAVWQATSALFLIPASDRAAGMARLYADLAGGRWHHRYGHLLTLDELDLGYCIVIARP